MTFESRRLFWDKLETGFTIVFIFFLSMLTLSIMVYAADIYRFSGLKEILAASPKTPWGLVTSFFVHADEAHLSNNMIALFLFLVVLVFSNVFLPKEEIKRRIVNSLLVISLIPVVLNLFLISFFPQVKMIGSSGIVYALEGTCLGFSLLNAFALRQIGRYFQNRRTVLLTLSLSNLAVSAGLLLSLALFPKIFLGSGSQVTIWFHALAFCGGFAAILPFSAWQRIKRKEQG